MSLRRCIAALATFAALATPGTALAQSAGDDQYQDPFGGSSATPTPTPAASSPGTAAPAPAPSTSSTAPAAASAQAPAVASTSRSQLPYTGSPVDAALLAVAGAVLLGGGLTLRARVREH